MKTALKHYFSLGMILGVMGVSLPAQAAFFQGLGDLPGGGFESFGNGVSADGSVVVGFSSAPGGQYEAFRWTPSTGMVGLGLLPGDSYDSRAYGVSGDGSVIVGASYFNNGAQEAFRWTQGTGMVGLGDLPGGSFTSRANGVSGDGSVIVGTGNSGLAEAFRWTQATGMVGLSLNTEANAVSGDGSVIVGYGGNFINGEQEAFRWTQSTGAVGLGKLPDTTYSRANGVSADGSAVVGYSGVLSGAEAFRWTQATGMVGLGDFPGGNFLSIANGVSGDGSVVVGSGQSANDTAFIWDATNGFRSLQDVLVNNFGLGSALTGWSLNEATAISPDGLTIVGTGQNPNNQREAWIANLGATLGTTPGNPFLPTPNPDNPNGFSFVNVRVIPGRFFYIDPDVAVGYDYSVTGGPLFASVLIPNALPNGDSNFTLELPGFGNYSLIAGTAFDLLGVNPLGFSNFRISDIDLAEMLDPTNPTAFVTGLTFTAAGTVTVNQNPIVQNTDSVSVPEPSSLFGLGLLGLGFIIGGKKRSR
jgi:probable HAF family extracellular repeat protein